MRWKLVACVVLLLTVTADAAPKRLRAVIRQFLVDTGYPNGRPGHVVDHLVPICAGGFDGPPNLQWQERQASYRKDVFERQLCREMKKQGLRMIRAEPQ